GRTYRFRPGLLLVRLHAHARGRSPESGESLPFRSGGNDHTGRRPNTQWHWRRRGCLWHSLSNPWLRFHRWPAGVAGTALRRMDTGTDWFSRLFADATGFAGRFGSERRQRLIKYPCRHPPFPQREFAMTASSFSSLLIDKRNAVAYLTLNRPEKRNALS